MRYKTSKTKGIRDRLFIFLRAALIVILHTSSVYCISKENFLGAICLSAGISFMWILNVKDLSVSDWQDRVAYILGGVVGTTTSLYGLSLILN